MLLHIMPFCDAERTGDFAILVVLSTPFLHMYSHSTTHTNPISCDGFPVKVVHVLITSDASH